MKVTSTKVEEKPKFQPFTLNLLIETEEEAIELYCLFNHSILVEFVKNLKDSDIRSEIKKNVRDFDYSAKHLELNRMITR